MDNTKLKTNKFVRGLLDYIDVDANKLMLMNANEYSNGANKTDSNGDRDGASQIVSIMRNNIECEPKINHFFCRVIFRTKTFLNTYCVQWWLSH